MRAYHGMPVTEFIDQLRSAAINGKAAPAVIDMIDSLQECETLESERDVAQSDLDTMKENRDDLQEAIEMLLRALPDEFIDTIEDKVDDIRAIKALMAGVAECKNAIERSGTT